MYAILYYKITNISLCVRNYIMCNNRLTFIYLFIFIRYFSVPMSYKLSNHSETKSYLESLLSYKPIVVDILLEKTTLNEKLTISLYGAYSEMLKSSWS